MNEPTNPLAESPDTSMRRRAEIARMAPSKGTCGTMPGPVERSTGAINGSDAISIHGHKCRKCADCGWSVTGVPQSRAADRARLKELASNYGAKCRVNGVGNEVCNAWAAFTAAVDDLVGDE